MAGVPGIDGVVGKATEPMVDEVIEKLKKCYVYIIHYKKKVEEAQKKRDKLESKIKDLEEQVEIGERKLEKVGNMAGDALKQAHEVRNRKEWEKLNEPEKTGANNKCGIGLLACNLVYRYRLGKQATGLIQNVDKVKEELEKFGSNKVTQEQGPLKFSSLPSSFSESLSSRKEMVERICKDLIEKDVRLIGIHGMGGAGKTTLANEVARRVEGAFDPLVMVEVSQTPNIQVIQERISERIGLGLDKVHSIEERARKLHERLRKQEESKKALVILDNVWKKLDLDNVGIPRSCKLLVTTREEDVCRTMDAAGKNIIGLGVLEKEEAKELFLEKVRDTIKKDAKYEPLMNKVLEKCSGLPLAIAVLGDTLKNQSLDSWRSVVASLGKQTMSNVKGIDGQLYSIFELSYKRMESDEKKQYLLLCCLFPLGSNINIEELMRYGIGLGLFQNVNSLTEATQQAHSWVDEFQSSSWLLGGGRRNPEMDESESTPSLESDLKIHDVVRAAILNIASKGGHACQVGTFPQWLMEETYKKYAAISMADGDSHESLGEFHFPKLKILLLKGSKPSSYPDDFFKRMRNLKVLVLKGMEFPRALPSSMALLKNLRTLHLQRCKLQNISVIGKLLNLVVLSLKVSTIKELSIEIGNLHHLKLLDLTNCYHLQNIPPNIIAKLSQLEGLYMLPNWWVHIERQVSWAELECLKFVRHFEVNVPTIEEWPCGLK